ncbi:peptidase inhibitor family I36 protein [Streptomyces sp. NPDC052225]|uniref:peptidase inhibitor family I36 protein n=1 Tax=Streptomyces sp. NPDC052225 TaxID=3154949 RepID=UPI00343519CB
MRTSMPVTIAAAALAAVALTPGLARAAAPPTLGDCAAGELCLWSKTGFKGARHTYELSGIDIESCVALPEGSSAASLANRTGRPVTTYQSAECAETGEFQTYPGSGTWEPESPYRTRAFKVWER